MARILKIIADYISKQAWDYSDLRPKGLFEMSEYFRHNGPITFHYNQNEDGTITAVSENFRFGSIITSGRDPKELDLNIKDAILTSFEIPSAYSKEAKVEKVGEERKEYALA